MNGEEVLRMIDFVHANKDIPREVIFRALEEALASSVRKRLGMDEDLVVKIDRKSGDVSMEDDEGVYEEMDMAALGRIAAQAAKQGFMQRVREAERDVLFEEYEGRVGQLVNGVVQRYEGQDLVVNLGKVEGYLSREDRVRGETYAPSDRIRAIIVEVREEGNKVRIQLSRTHPDLVRRLFELEVPEIADGIIEIKRVVREPGYRTKMAVQTSDPKVDCIGACVGVRGSRIRAAIDELRGERIDIIRWSDSLETLIMNGLKPAEIHLDNIYPNVETHSAVVLVDEDQQSLAIGKRGQNVRLASRLCGWEIEIKTREEYYGTDSSAEAGAGAAAKTPSDLLEADEPMDFVSTADDTEPTPEDVQG
ncbi:MAG: transcription termination factor NusA [Planctomycetes bacterium]|nr:transcription termination factor NusA [Planctomycetota bacterium]MCB9912152.1 transcription termination factor NusA [Planctomycetota bacterium]HPF12832.1 transcription termination factor NusA [Planctomycetota bacterium]